MKYKKILIFLILCIIVLSCALISFAFFSRDMRGESSNVVSSQNTNVQSIYKNNSIENNLTENVTDENNTLNNVAENNSDEQIKSENSTDEKNKPQTVSKSEEENIENEKNNQDKENTAIELTKNEWGEDETVYYTIDRSVNNVYDISVRSKETTQTLAEYEVDIISKTVEIK